jgi:molybdate-binding protein/DNA-binding XRE family transcriptional regulator
MSNPPRNQVRALRESRGLSQVGLAETARLSRQSIGAIEAGRTTPAVDVALRIAQALDCRVEDLFAQPATESLTAEPASSALGPRVALARVAGRWIAHPLQRSDMRHAADGLVTGGRGSRTPRGSVAVQTVRPASELARTFVMMGCAAGLGVLAERLSTRAGSGRFLWLSRASTGAIDALARTQTHLAGVHLVDPETGAADLRQVRALARTQPLALITLARWEVGLVTAAKNPKRIRSVADFGRRELRLVTRESGSGAQRVLEAELRRAGLPLSLARAARVRASGQLEAACAVAMGAADGGIVSRDAALAFGLEFLPLSVERYDLVVPVSERQDPRMLRLLDEVASGPFRRELESLGYDARSSGDRVADFSA